MSKKATSAKGKQIVKEVSFMGIRAGLDEKPEFNKLPVEATYELVGDNDLLNALICAVTGKEVQELGLIDSYFQYSIKDKTPFVCSAFYADKIGDFNKIATSVQVSYPEIEKFQNILYPGDVVPIQETRENDDGRMMVVFRWNARLVAAALLNVSLLSTISFEYDSAMDESKKKDRKKARDIVPLVIRVKVNTRGNKNGEYNVYDPSEVNEYFDIMRKKEKK